jgi:hypothetical protein
MDLTEGSETSAKLNLTPGENPKENTQHSEHGETLKSRIPHYVVFCTPVTSSLPGPNIPLITLFSDILSDMFVPQHQ